MYSVYYYKIPFIKPIKLRGGILHYREGLILQKEQMYSEIAPLPFFSKETLDDSKKDLFLFLKSKDKTQIKTPSVSFAINYFENNLSKIPRKKGYSFISNIFDNDETSTLSNKKLYKIKVGLFEFNDELKKVNEIKDKVRKLILDSNCQLSKTQAQSFINILGDKLEYLEDPCNKIEECTELNCNIAFDELFRHNKNLLSSKYNKYLKIIKPMMFYNVFSFLNKQINNSIDNKIILSSSFESIVGISNIEKMSTFYNLPTPGTDTLKYFDKELHNLNYFISNICNKEI
ncbi:MAG: hypothetical protein ACI4V7_03305 [Succinivibrionaceae bacterium]